MCSKFTIKTTLNSKINIISGTNILVIKIENITSKIFLRDTRKAAMTDLDLELLTTSYQSHVYMLGEAG